MSIEKALQLDKRLDYKRQIDGSITIFRKSPFNARVDYSIVNIRNQFIGSGRWLRDHIIKMDTQRQDIFARVRENNKSIHNKKDDNRAHREIAEMFESGGDTFIN